MESISQSVPRDLLVHLSLSCTTVTSTPLSSLSSSSFSLEAASVKPPCPLVLVLPANYNYWFLFFIGISQFDVQHLLVLQSTIQNNPFLSLQWVTFNLFQGPPYNGSLTTNDYHFHLNAEISKDRKVKHFNSATDLMNGRTQISN